MRALPLLLLSLACRPPIDAPDRTEEQVVFAFVNYEREGHVEAVTPPLIDFVADPPQDLAEGYLVDLLTADDLEAVGIERPDVDGIVGALGRATYDLDVATVARALTDPARPAWIESLERAEILDEEGDRDCFLAGDCTHYAFTLEEENRVALLGKTVRTITNELRWLPAEDGPPTLAIRQLVPEPVDIGSALVELDQQYAFILITPFEGGALRMETIWVDARVVGLDVPEGYAVRQAVRQMQAVADDYTAVWGDGAP